MSQRAPFAIASDQIGQGFVDPVRDAQEVFRATLAALAEPGTRQSLQQPLAAPRSLHPTTGRLLLTLADFETPVWLSTSLDPAAAAWIRFHCGPPVVTSPAEARFAIIDGGEAGQLLREFDPGTDRYPDRSATLLVQVSSLDGGELVTLSGPGIETTRQIAPSGLHQGFWSAFSENHQRYPRGVDLLLVAGNEFVGLPRSTVSPIPQEVA
jgi:alpha-D-ribose 1-methylphosphonate 5-triphosphate synthase subunit PhnH